MHGRRMGSRQDLLTAYGEVGIMAREKPNVLFVLTDDQGIWASGCYGNPEIRTLNIDRLAATGMRFQNFFVGRCDRLTVWECPHADGLGDER